MDIASMTIKELGGWAAVILFAVSTLVEIAPLEINPWSTLARKLGRAINGELMEKVDLLEGSVETLSCTVAIRTATDARTRILRFGDECLHGEKHSKEHFDQILRDITEYEQYCENHPEFKNNMAVLTISSIKENYQRCLTEHDFL